MKIKSHKLLLLIMMMSGCSSIPENTRFDAIKPETLMQSRNNTVSLNINSSDDISRLKSWLESEIPSRAEVGCVTSTKTCSRIMKLLSAYGVSIAEVSGLGSDVKLTYSRVTARDCNPEYIDRVINPYNFGYNSAGCATSANIIRMVSDRTQFSNPRTSGDADAVRAAKVYNSYIGSPVGDTQLQILNQK